jgi:hypothetical protein
VNLGDEMAEISARGFMRVPGVRRFSGKVWVICPMAPAGICRNQVVHDRTDIPLSVYIEILCYLEAQFT